MSECLSPAVQRVGQGAIRAAAARIAPHVRRTPVIEVDGADFGAPGARLVFKLEFLQHAGSFKSRGAFNSLLTRKLPAAGVVAASGGNHGAAVAYAAMRLGVRATIFVPEVASPAKIAQIRGYGARLEVGGERYADALAASERFAAESGAEPIHAFDQVATLEGQGTVALEFEEQAPGLAAVLVAVGGGGLIGGMAAWYAGRVPLVGVEPEEAPTLTRALEAGEPVDAPAGGVAADSLAPRRVGTLMFPLAQRLPRGHGAGDRRRDSRGAARAMEDAARGGRARRRRGARGHPLGPLPGALRPIRRRAALRCQHHRGQVRLTGCQPRRSGTSASVWPLLRARRARSARSR